MYELRITKHIKIVKKSGRGRIGKSNRRVNIIYT
jgi:hypothetical protein